MSLQHRHDDSMGGELWERPANVDLASLFRKMDHQHWARIEPSLRCGLFLCQQAGIRLPHGRPPRMVRSHNQRRISCRRTRMQAVYKLTQGAIRKRQIVNIAASIAEFPGRAVIDARWVRYRQMNENEPDLLICDQRLSLLHNRLKAGSMLLLHALDGGPSHLAQERRRGILQHRDLRAKNPI